MKLHDDERVGEFRFTSTGAHDTDLSIAEFLAWKRVEWAARLEYMAEARGRPRPGALHPEALPDDPDGVHGGEQPEDANFGCEEALPGATNDFDDQLEPESTGANPELNYASRLSLDEDQAFDMIHRLEE